MKLGIHRPQGRRLSPEDAARLHMSLAHNPMVVTALLRLDREIDREAFEIRLATRIARHPRFRQRVVESRYRIGMPRWVSDPEFDVQHHVHRLDASLLPGVPSLEKLVSGLGNIPLGETHPLWRVHLVEGPDPALVFVVHHALADGAALLGLLAELADEARAPGAPSGPRARAERRSTPPDTLRARVLRAARGATAAGRFALRRADPETPLNREAPLGDKVLSASKPFSLERLRDAAHEQEMTLTGLLLVALGGALCEELGPTEVVLHALVPVNVRHEESSPVLGNHYGSILVPLAVGAELAERRKQVADAMRNVAASGSAAASLATAAGAVSAFVERVGVELLSRKASVVVSSVRGPTSPLHVCGAAVNDIVVWAPAPGHISTSVTLMSYAGRVRIGVAADAHVIDDAERLTHELELELERICALA